MIAKARVFLLELINKIPDIGTVLNLYFLPRRFVTRLMNRPGMSGDSSSWKGWGHVRWFIEEVPAGAA